MALRGSPFLTTHANGPADEDPVIALEGVQEKKYGVRQVARTIGPVVSSSDPDRLPICPPCRPGTGP